MGLERRPARPERIPSSHVGQAAQYLLCSLIMLQAGGRLKVSVPHIDDHRVDFLIHKRGEFSRPLSVQAKAKTALHTDGRIHFDMRDRAHRLVASPSFWYLFAGLEPGTATVSDPVFLVPSKVVHRMFLVGENGTARFSRSLSLNPDSRDLWVRYRLSPDQLGRRIEGIIEELPR